MKKTFLRWLGALSAIALTAAGQTHITMMVHTNGTLETPTNFFVANSNLLNQSISLTASGVQVAVSNGIVAHTNAGVVTANLAANVLTNAALLQPAATALTNVTVARAQRGVAAMVQGLQQIILSDGTNAFADLVEGAFFAQGQNQGTPANLVGLKGSLGTGVNVVQTNGGFYLNGSTSEIVFSNIPPQYGPLTAVVWMTGMGWNQTADAVPMGIYHTNGANEGNLEVFYATGSGDTLNGLVGNSSQTYQVANTGNFYPNQIYSTPYFISFQSDLKTLVGSGFSGANNGVITNTQFASTSFSYNFTTYPLSKIVLGAALLTNSTYGNNFNGVISGFLLFSNYLSSAQLLQVQALAYNTVSPLRRLVFTGDSLTVGWWIYAVTNYPFWGNASYVLNGISGQPLEWMTQNFYDRQGTNFQNGNDLIYPATELFWGGADNTFSDTGAQAYVYVSNEVADVHALGAKIFVSTMMENASTGTGGAPLAYQQSFNALVRANTAGADGIADNDLMFFDLIGTNYNTDATYFTDGTHCTALGYSYIATNWGISISTNFWTPNNYFVGYPQVAAQLAVNPTNINSIIPTNNLPGDLPQISTDNLANGTNLNASKLASGTVPLARLNSAVLTNNEAAAASFTGNVTVPTLNSTFLVNVLSFSSDGAQFYSDGAGNVYAPAFVATNAGGYGFVGNGISLTNGNASAFFHSGTVPETRWLSTGAGNASEVIVNNSAGNAVPTNAIWDALLGANLQGWDLIPTNQVIITNDATSGYILQYYQGAMQWIPTNWPASGGGGSSPTFSSQFDNIGGHTNISVAVNLTNAQLSGGVVISGGETNNSSANITGGLGVGTLTPPGNGSIVATNNVNVGGALTATNPALYWSGSPTFAIQTGAGSFLAAGATATVVSGSMDCAGHLVFVNGSASATNTFGYIIGTVTLAHTAPNTNYQVLFGATGDNSAAWKLQQAYLTATNITTSGFAIAVTGDGAQSFNAAATWGTVYAVYPPIP